MAAAKNVGMWHRGVEKVAEALENAWRCADLRQSNVWRQLEAKGRQQSIHQQRHRDNNGSGRKTGWNGQKTLFALFLIGGWGKSMYSTV